MTLSADAVRFDCVQRHRPLGAFGLRGQRSDRRSVPRGRCGMPSARGNRLDRDAFEPIRPCDALGGIGVRPSISRAQSSRLSLQLTRRIPPAISQKATSQPSSVKQGREHAGYDRLAIQQGRGGTEMAARERLPLFQSEPCRLQDQQLRRECLWQTCPI